MTTLRDGRVFFGGDAAHVHSPAGGQGMNAGIQDMINLSWKLAMVLEGQARPELLDTYESDRLPAIRQLVRMTERATMLFNSTTPLVHAAVTRLAPVLLSRSAVQYRAARRLGQLSAGYRRCPITKGGGRIGSLHAGERVPDARLGGVRLYEMLDLATLTLFVSPDAGRIADAFRPWENLLALRPVADSRRAGRRCGVAAGAAGWLPRGCRRTQRRAAARRLAGSLAHSTSSLSAARALESRRRSTSSVNAHSAVAAIHSPRGSTGMTRGWGRTVQAAILGSRFEALPTGHVAFSSEPEAWLNTVLPFVHAAHPVRSGVQRHG